jgi:hypothetical protein
MAGKACHVVASTTQVGLIQALGRTGCASSCVAQQDLRTVLGQRAGSLRSASHLPAPGFDLRLQPVARRAHINRWLRPHVASSAGARPRRGRLVPAGNLGQPEPRCCSVSAKGSGCGGPGRGPPSRPLRPNNSFKPTPLRYTKHMAERACHVFGSPTRCGLTRALGSGCSRSATSK